MNVKQKCQLRGKAHSLKPIVMIGSHGLADGVVTEIARALYDHELIKVKVPASSKAEKQQLAAEICQRNEAELIQIVGNVIILYKKSDKED